jgi:hypothetical protein
MAATGDRQRGGFLTATGADLLTVDKGSPIGRGHRLENGSRR